MAKSVKTEQHKKAMLKALEDSLGIVTIAARDVGISRTTHHTWYNTDPKYKAAVDELTDVALDFAENKLHKNIEKGKEISTIFYLKTKGKKRGYVERQEITGADGETVNIAVVEFIGGKPSGNNSPNTDTIS